MTSGAKQPGATGEGTASAGAPRSDGTSAPSPEPPETSAEAAPEPPAASPTRGSEERTAESAGTTTNRAPVKPLDCDNPAECRHAFLAKASAELAASLDHDETMGIIARLAVPELADWVAFDIVTGADEFRRVVAEPAPKNEIEMSRLTENIGSKRRDHGVRKVFRTGDTDFVPELTDAVLDQVAVDEDHRQRLLDWGLKSVISAPLNGHDRVLGAITFAYVGDRRYTEDDVQMVEELADRAATAFENAWIVAELTATHKSLEEKSGELEEKSEQLEVAMQRLSMNVEQSPLGIIDTEVDGTITAWNPAAERIFGYSAAEAIGERISFIFKDPDRLEMMFPAIARDRRKIRRTSIENVRKDGQLISCTWYATPIIDGDGEVIAISGAVADTTYRQEMEDEVQLQVDRLSALRSIDMAITASLDLNVTLSVLLDQVVSQLKVDAGNVLLVNRYTKRLQYAAGRGFRTNEFVDIERALGEGTAGKAALDRRTVALPSFENTTMFVRARMIEAEQFVSYYCTPLISKGRVTGVLEVYSRTPLHAGSDWIAFFETLAGQAAIAADNAQLFENLQRSNLDLHLAYDSTLEGWARALDLRDGVTQGHSRRVTGMAERLASEVGIPDAELINVRRGALLHDIGKMGIPDSILHKKGPLTEDEWDTMKKHPVYAWDLLHPIEFLRPALDIPCAHHEHWDGSGYPRGLRGRDIPLAARVFAIVDVWDALRSDRPYSKSWSEDDARAQIRDLAGSHLDPELVEVFLGMDWDAFHNGAEVAGQHVSPPQVNSAMGREVSADANPPADVRPDEHEGRASAAAKKDEPEVPNAAGDTVSPRATDDQSPESASEHPEESSKVAVEELNNAAREIATGEPTPSPASSDAEAVRAAAPTDQENDGEAEVDQANDGQAEAGRDA